MDLFGDIEGLGGAVSSLFGAKGSEAAGSAYGTAATIAGNNEALTLRSGEIQEEQEQRTITQTVGAESAGVAGAGFSGGKSGSAVDLMRSSVQQGALSKQLIANQTEITAQGYAQQQAAYEGQQQGAEDQAKAQTSSGIGGILGIASDVLGFL